MAFGKERMSSFVDRGNKLIAEGKTKVEGSRYLHGVSIKSSPAWCQRKEENKER